MDKKAIITRFIGTNLEFVSKEFALEFKKTHNLSTNQMSAIWYLREKPGMKMIDLANKMQMSRQQMTKLIDSLEEKNLVERQINEVERRSVILFDTDEAYQIIDAMQHAYYGRLLGKLEKLSNEDQDRFFESLDFITNTFISIN